MRRQFSIATLLGLVAACAAVFAMARWLGYDGVILATPFLGAGAAGRFACSQSAPAQQRRTAATVIGGLVVTAVCLADPRPHTTTGLDLVLGTSTCFLYGLAATACLEASARIRRRLGRWTVAVVSRRSGAFVEGISG